MKFILDTNILIKMIDLDISLKIFKDIYITDFTNKEFLDYYENSPSFKEEDFDKRKVLLKKIVNIIKTEEIDIEILTKTFEENQKIYKIDKKEGLNDILLISISKMEVYKNYTFVCEDKELEAIMRKNTKNIINFGEYREKYEKGS